MKNIFKKSKKYDELINMYAEIAKNGCNTVHGKFTPPEEVFGKSNQMKFRNILKSLFHKHNVKTLLDYGSGQGNWNELIEPELTLKKFLNLKDIHKFEPARDLNKKTYQNVLFLLMY